MGVTENAGPKCRSSSESERKLHENMLAACSLMYIQLILYHATLKSVSAYNLIGPSLVGAQVAPEIVREVGQNIVSVDVNTG